MNLTKKIILSSAILLLGACANYKIDKPKQVKEKKFYSSKGFALIYSDSLFEQGGIDKKLNKNEIIDNKLNNEQIITMHSLLKKNTINSEDWIYSVTKINECIFIPFLLVSTLSKRSNGDLGSIA